MKYFSNLVKAWRGWQNRVESVSDLPPSGILGEVRLVLDEKTLYFWNGTAWEATAGGGGGSSNSFTTIQTDAGTSPVATSPNDTLTLTSSDGSIKTTGDSSSDEVDFRVDIDGLTEDTTPDKATDFVMTYDASSLGLKKVKLSALGSNSLNGLFGSGVDGNVVISSDSSLTEDMYYNNLTVNLGCRLDTANFRIFVRNLADLSGVISCNGNNANPSTNSAGGARTSGSLGASYAGGSGGISGAGGAGANALNSLGGAGGAGGAGASGTGGAGGTVGNVITANGGPKVWNNAFTASSGRANNAALVNFGAGGGGGGSDGFSTAGGGGGGGGVLLYSKRLSGTGTIEAKGGNSRNNSTGNKGGGGGGGGGCVVLFSETKLSDTSLTVSVDGGIGGLATGTGINGANGSPGTFIDLTGAD